MLDKFTRNNQNDLLSNHLRKGPAQNIFKVFNNSTSYFLREKITSKLFYLTVAVESHNPILLMNLLTEIHKNLWKELN